VALPAEADDVAQAAAHLGVLILEHLQGVGELIAGVAPGAMVPGFLVAAVFAIQERELRGWCGGELTQPRSDQRRLAVAGEAGGAEAGEPAQRRVRVVAEVVTPDVQQGRPMWPEGARRTVVRAERLGERVSAECADDEAAGSGLGDADADRPPVVSDVGG